MDDKLSRKRRVAKQVAIVRDALRKWDPMGLAPGRMAPADEYDGYAPAIVSLISRGCTVAELSEHLERLRTSDTTVDEPPAAVAERLRAAVSRTDA